MRFCKYFIVVSLVLTGIGWMGLALASSSQTPHDVVWEYFEHFAHKDYESISALCYMSEGKMEQLQSNLEAYFTENLHIGIVPILRDIILKELRATIMVDVKTVLFFDSWAGTADIPLAEQFEKQATRVMFELEADPNTAEWAITNIYTKMLEWPVPPACDERLSVLALMPATESVINDLVEVREQYEDLAEINNVMAAKYFELGDTVKAREALENVLAKEPANYFAHILLADISYKNGQKDQAESHAHQAIRFCPFMQNPNHHVIVGYVLVGTGEVKEGRDHLRIYLKREPEGIYRKQVAEVLGELDRIEAQLSVLKIFVTVDGKAPRAIRMSVWETQTQELVDVGFSSPFTVNRIFPGLYDVSCEIQGVTQWKRDIEVLPSRLVEEHIAYQTGIIEITVYKSKLLPFLDTVIFLMAQEKEEYLARLEDYKGEFRVLPGVYDILIRNEAQKAIKKIQGIHIESNETVTIEHDFDFQKVFICIEPKDPEDSMKAYVVRASKPEIYLQKIDSWDSLIYLQEGSYQLVISVGNEEKWVDFEVKNEIECNLHIVLNQ